MYEQYTQEHEKGRGGQETLKEMWHFSPQTNKNSPCTKEIDKENMMCSPMCTAPRGCRNGGRWKENGARQ